MSKEPIRMILGHPLWDEDFRAPMYDDYYVFLHGGVTDWNGGLLGRPLTRPLPASQPTRQQRRAKQRALRKAK